MYQLENEDRIVVKLNQELIHQQGVKPDCVERLEQLHIELLDILNQPENYGEPSEVVQLIEGYEYALQALWNFSINSDFHVRWFGVKGCKCPSMDNLELFGSPKRIFNQKCPFHGKVELYD